MKKFLTLLFWILIATGLLIRILSISYLGIFDMTTYNEWGLDTLKNGLAQAYSSGYFPFQYQIFEVSSWLSLKFNTQYFVAFKIVNLLFDCGNIFMLYLIFKRLYISKFWLILYWLHPWFLLMFSQGYCDLHFTFFILCTIYFTLKSTTRDFLIAGIFLGFATMMKPQVQVVVLALLIYGTYLYIKHKEIKMIYLFIFPAIMFIDYSLYFFIETGKPYIILKAYLESPDGMPLTANFLNGWFPVAYYLKMPGEPIYSVTDDVDTSGAGLRSIALLLLLLLIFFFIKKVADDKLNKKGSCDILHITTFATMIFPFIMTSAHENHLFLATVLLIPALAKIKNLSAKISIHVILILQCINMYGFYGYGDSKKFNLINVSYTYEIAFILSLIAFIAFLVLVRSYLSRRAEVLAIL